MGNRKEATAEDRGMTWLADMVGVDLLQHRAPLVTRLSPTWRARVGSTYEDISRLPAYL